MNQNEPDNAPTDTLDRAVAQRLARLRTMPVELAALRKAVEAQVPRPTRADAPPAPRSALWFVRRPLRAAVACLLVLGAIGLAAVLSAGSPVLASADRLATLHAEMVAGGDHVTRVDSIDAANKALAADWSKSPGVPAVPHEQVMSCCVHQVGRKRVACVGMMADGAAVTIAVADAADVKLPPGCETRTVDGVTYHLQSSADVNMVMVNRAGRWICLMGKVPTDRLLQMAAEARP